MTARRCHAPADADRLALVERILVRFPRFERLREKIGYCHEHSKIAAEPECLLITGPTGAGKTTLCRVYEREHPRTRSDEGAIVPVLSASIPVPATAKSLATRLLATLGDPLADKGSTVSQTLRLVRYLEECGVEVILLDEFQHFIDRDSNHVLETVANWLKDLLNETGTPIVLVGLPYSEAILRANDQLERRFAAREAIRPFGWSTSDEQTEFRMLLATLDAALPFEQRAGLDEFEAAARLFAASGGRIGLVMALVRRAAGLAIERGLDRIELDALAWAFDERFATTAADRPNPFRVAFDEIVATDGPRADSSQEPQARPRRSRAEDGARHLVRGR
jgi:type II secretory pathway predicted ATPase ExeA